MKNNFYCEFDFERLEPSKRTVDYRNPFQIDRDRIIHSSEFRRLQGKTQVFLPGEYDFYRTRLTHTIEAAQIGRSIGNYLAKKENSPFGEEFYIDPDLVECVCLAHDLGHPPFGHAGERTLNRLMEKYGGFEGNAQTLRMLTEIIYREEKGRRGMKPTRAFLDGILKYKATFSQKKNPENQFIYDYQNKYLAFIFPDKDHKDELETVETLNSFRSIECQIMDWADDTAYALNDMVDSIAGGFITIAKLINWGADNDSSFSPAQKKYLDEIIEWTKEGSFKQKFGSKIGEFILACDIEEQKTFMDDLTNRYRYKLKISEEAFDRVEFYKRVAIELVFRSSQLHQMEFKGDKMIEGIFNVFEDNYVVQVKPIKLLSDFSDKIIRGEPEVFNRARLICDQIAGMTDSYAVKNYRRLFDPDYSSLSDLV
ncbi:dGTP triphosphohydrolase [Bacteroidota bacterium]